MNQGDSHEDIRRAASVADPRLDWRRISPDVLRELITFRKAVIWSATADRTEGRLSLVEWNVINGSWSFPQQIDNFDDILSANPNRFDSPRSLGPFGGIGALVVAFLSGESEVMCIAEWVVQKTCLAEDKSIDIDWLAAV